MDTPRESESTTPPAEIRPGTPAERPAGMVTGWTTKGAFNTPGFMDFLGDTDNYADANEFNSGDENTEQILERWNDFMTDREIKKILKKPKFEEFLTRFLDADDVPHNFQGAEKIKERLALFEDSQAVALNLKKIHQGKLRAHKAGSLSVEEVKGFQDYAENLAVLAPDELITLKEELKTAEELPPKIKEAEKAYEAAKAEKTAHQRTLETALDPLRTLKGFKGFRVRLNNIFTSTEKLETKVKKLRESRDRKDNNQALALESLALERKRNCAKKEISRLEAEMSRCQELVAREAATPEDIDDAVRASRESIREARESIFSKVSIGKEIHRRACEAVQDRLAVAMESGNLGKLEGALQEINRYDELAQEDPSENYFLDTASGSTEAPLTPEELKEEVQKRIEAVITKGIVDKLSMIRAGATSQRMDALLMTFVQKVKTGLGIKGKEEAWDFLTTTLRAQEGIAVGARKIALTRFISVIEAKRAEEEAATSTV